MELTATLLTEYDQFNSASFAGKIEESGGTCFPSELEFTQSCNNDFDKRLLSLQLASELRGGLMDQFLRLESNVNSSPFWQFTLLHYKNPFHELQAESDGWVLKLDSNINILTQLLLLQKRTREYMVSGISMNVLCLGAMGVVGIPELEQEGGNLHISCVESDEKLLFDLETVYAQHTCNLKLIQEDFHQYYPDRKYDMIIYPSGKSWQESEKMHELVERLSHSIDSKRIRVLAF